MKNPVVRVLVLNGLNAFLLLPIGAAAAGPLDELQKKMPPGFSLNDAANKVFGTPSAAPNAPPAQPAPTGVPPGPRPGAVAAAPQGVVRCVATEINGTTLLAHNTCADRLHIVAASSLGQCARQTASPGGNVRFNSSFTIRAACRYNTEKNPDPTLCNCEPGAEITATSGTSPIGVHESVKRAEAANPTSFPSDSRGCPIDKRDPRWARDYPLPAMCRH